METFHTSGDWDALKAQLRIGSLGCQSLAILLPRGFHELANASGGFCTELLDCGLREIRQGKKANSRALNVAAVKVAFRVGSLEGGRLA